MKKNKIIILLVIIIAYVVALFVILLGNKKTEEKNTKNNEKKYIVVDNFARLSFSNNSWSKASTSEIESYGEYKVLINNKPFGNYKLEYGTTWNLFNNANDYIDYEGNLFAYSDNFNINVVTLEKNNFLSDENKKIISEYFNYDDYSNLITNDVITVDIDNNGVMDEVVCVSNIGIDKKYKSKYYNLIFIKLNDEIIEILNQNSSNSKIMEEPVYNLSTLFELNRNKYLVIKKTIGIDSDTPTESVLLYQQLNSDNFKKVKISS